MASSGDLPSLRSASSAKSIIMMAFFLTMPIKQDDADERNDAELRAAQHQREDGADTRGRQRGENRDGMNVAFVQNAEHDVDGDQRRENQNRLVGERILKCRGGALERP